MAATTWSSGHERKLWTIAKAKRSKARNLRPLKMLALEKFAGVPLTARPSLHVIDDYLTPALRREILEYLEDHCSLFKRLSLENAKWMLRMVDSLLDASVKVFNFNIFCKHHWADHHRDLLIWQKLAQRCPNLETVHDVRTHGDGGKGKFLMRDVLPFLAQCPNLQHIQLQEYVCDATDLAIIAANHPNLKTLRVKFEVVRFETLKNLFALQNLENISISWHMNLKRDEKNQILRDEQKYYYRHFKAECLENLPKLRVCWGGENHHNTVPYRGDRMLSMIHLSVCGTYDFNLVPCLEYLALEEPSMGTGNINLLSTCNHLTELELSDVDWHSIKIILEVCGRRLEALKIENCNDDEFKPFWVLAHCPRLKTLDLSECISSENTDLLSYKEHVNIGHVQHLKEFFAICNATPLPSSFIALVLSAPNLEIFHMADDLIFYSNDLKNLLRPLTEGLILQKLHLFYFSCKDDNVNPNLMTFLCILASHAPLLKKLEVSRDSGKIIDEINNCKLITELCKLPDFKFCEGI